MEARSELKVVSLQQSCSLSLQLFYGESYGEEKRNNEILVNERGETMGIIAFEGASAVGKSTTCRELEKNYGAYIIPEVNSLFESKNEHRTWYFEKQVERWNIAVQKSEQYELVILDGDIYQPLSYNWCFHFDIFNQPLSLIENFYKEKMINRKLVFRINIFIYIRTMKNLESGKYLMRRKEEETLKNIYIYQNRFSVIMKI